MRTQILRNTKKVLSDSLPARATKADLATHDTSSLYEKLRPFATPVNVKGIWRAPRVQGFTKEQFDKAYPLSYKSMRIGLPSPGSLAAKHVDPRFDEISPLVWTLIMFTPLTYWYAYEYYSELFPPKEISH